MILQIIELLSVSVAFGWYSSSSIVFLWIQFQNPPEHKIADILLALRAELQPFYLAACTALVMIHMMNGDSKDLWIEFDDACRFALWFLYRNLHDDDRWKRRRAKAAEAIKRVGSRLVVVPATEGAS